MSQQINTRHVDENVPCNSGTDNAPMRIYVITFSVNSAVSLNTNPHLHANLPHLRQCQPLLYAYVVVFPFAGAGTGGRGSSASLNAGGSGRKSIRVKKAGSYSSCAGSSALSLSLSFTFRVQNAAQRGLRHAQPHVYTRGEGSAQSAHVLYRCGGRIGLGAGD
jgi:hypothetical protein